MEFQRRKQPIFCLLFVTFFFQFQYLCAAMNLPINDVDDNHQVIDVGMILDMGSREGKIISNCVTTALSDFYNLHDNYSTRIVLHTRDSKGKPLHALSAALNLLDNNNVEAVIGGHTRNEANLLAELTEEAKIPVISLSKPSPSKQYPFIVEITHNDTSQVMGISALIEMFNWRDIILLYQNMESGRDIIPSLISSFQEKNVHISYKSCISVSSTNEEIIEVLQTLKEFNTTVFVVHISHHLVPRLFSSNAKKLGLMNEGYVWILTSASMNFLNSMDVSVIESMQGVVGLKSYIPSSIGLNSLTSRLRRKFYIEEVDMEVREVITDGIWAYDATWALAEAVEKARIKDSITTKPGIRIDLMDLNNIRSSPNGVALLREISETRFKGLSGDIRYVDGKLITGSAFEIGNVIGKGDRGVGFWVNCEDKTIGKSEYSLNNRRNMLSKDDLETIIWPGGSSTITNGSRMQVRTKLKVGIPVGNDFKELVTVDHNINVTGTIVVTGFCIEVFKAAISVLPVEYDFIPFTGTYNDLVYQVYLKNFDAAAGDITITSNRSLNVEFTVPFSDLGVAMLVKNDEKRDMWIFMKPLSGNLWSTFGVFFVLTGLVVWIIEHPTNKKFQGTPGEQIGTVLCFAFSTLFFAHREKLGNNLAKFVVIIWMFVVLILTSSYTATLASMMTVKQIQLHPGDYIGYHSLLLGMGEYVKENMNYSGVKLYDSAKDFADALSRGSKQGGISAIIDEIPYIKVFLAKYPNGYSMIKHNSTTNGFGFVFPKGSQLVHDMSTQIMKMREQGKLRQIEKAWFDVPEDRNDPDTNSTAILTLKRFRGLFLISGVSSAFALFLFFILSMKEKYWDIVKKCINEFQIRELLQNVRMFCRSNRVSNVNVQMATYFVMLI